MCKINQQKTQHGVRKLICKRMNLSSRYSRGPSTSIRSFSHMSYRMYTFVNTLKNSCRLSKAHTAGNKFFSACCASCCHKFDWFIHFWDQHQRNGWTKQDGTQLKIERSQNCGKTKERSQITRTNCTGNQRQSPLTHLNSKNWLKIMFSLIRKIFPYKIKIFRLVC